MSPEGIWPILCLLSLGLNGYLVLSLRGGNIPPWISRLFSGGKPTVRMKEKILAVMEEGEQKGCIKSSERKLVENVLQFKERTAEDVMIHRRDAVMLGKEESHEDVMYQIIKTGLSRFPVYDQGADDVVGVLTTRKYLLNHVCSPEKTLGELMYPAYFVPKTVGAEQLLRDMQSRKMHMAIVVDEYGGVDGLVTLEDLLEEIVGNIYDEFDPLAQVEILPIAENLWRVSGSADLEDVSAVIGFTIPEDADFDTVSGLIYDELDMIPEKGSFPKIEAYGLVIQVEQIVDRRITWVTISMASPQIETSSA